FPLQCFFFSSRRRHTRCLSDWSSDVCSSDLSRSVVFSACSSRFHGFRLLPPLSTEGGGVDSRTKGKDRCGRIPRRGGSLSRSTCSPAQRATTWICADSAAKVCFPTIEGIAFSTPRINSRGCRQPCIWIGFLVSAPTPGVFPVSS